MLKNLKGIYAIVGIALIFLSACGGNNSAATNNNSTIIAADYYVDAVSGDDANSGSETSPFKTIGKALSVVVSGNLIQVQPGTYDVANGESFPLTIPDGVGLRGDENNKGNGTTATLIEGNDVVPSTTTSAALISGQGSSISGFSISAGGTTPGWFGVYSSDVDALLTNNTFVTSYGGVRLAGNGNPTITDNIFQTSSYGVHAAPQSGTPVIDNNNFITGSLPIAIGGNGTITNNSIVGSGQVGIQLQSGDTGSLLIENNTFTRSSYTYAALRCAYSSTPLVRSNTFNIDSGNIIQIVDTSNPDLGTAVDAGNNTFNSAAAVTLAHEGSASVNAIGNNWYSFPPICGTDIVITGGGSVTWGAGGSDNCP